MALERAESERLRESFADVLRRQAVEASQLASGVSEDPDLREALGEMLVRIQLTARSLALPDVETAAAGVAAALLAGEPEVSLDALLERCRAFDPRAAVLRPVLLVGVEGVSPDPLLRMYATVAEAADASRHERPLAVVIPADALLQIDGQVFAEVPRFVWRDGDALAARLGAAHAGAVGYFAAPLDLRTVGPRVRARLLRSGEPDRVLLVGPPEPVVVAWVRALAGAHVELTVVRSRDALLTSLEEVDPALVALADPRAEDLALVLRGHPDWWDLPRVVITDEPSLGLTELVLPASLPPERLRAQAIALLERARQERELGAMERGTGVLPRAALLRAADREIAVAQRTRQPLAAARIDIDEPAALKRSHGSAAVGAAVRLLARSLREVVRGTDVVGRLGDYGFGVLLPGASALQVRERLEQVERRFLDMARHDPRLVAVSATAGLADIEAEQEALFERAERDRLRTRRG